ncbi:MAG: hypothetical protein HUJ26_16605 [Planctomycetaceae bacterium]|nr:hypothetical protein [Planctomycetaceae bacterium]
MNSDITNDSFKWATETEDTDPIFFDNSDQLKEYVEQIMHQQDGELAVFKYFGKTRRRWWSRIFIPGEYHWSVLYCFTIRWIEDFAVLMFYDAEANEHRAFDQLNYISDASEDIRIRLGIDEYSPASPEQCLQKSRVLDACQEFIDTGNRPEWLNYECRV